MKMNRTFAVHEPPGKRLPGFVATAYAFAVPAILLATTSTSHAEYESAAFGVAKYNAVYSNGVRECPCTSTDGKKNCTDSSWFTTFAGTFNSRMDWMGYAQTELYRNQSVDGADFTDSTRFPDTGGDDVDPWGTDFADAIFLASHSSAVCSGSTFESSFGMGEEHPDQTCWPTTQREMRFGDADADVAILFSCQSVQKCVWDANHYSRMSAPSGSLSMVMGFHGEMYLNSEANGRLDDYLSDTKMHNIGEYWVDYLTDIQGLPWEQPDVCATIAMWGNTDAEIHTMYDHGGFMDFWPTGRHNRAAFYYWDECDPHGGEEL